MNDHAHETKREILVVSHYYDTHGGGIERAVRRLIDEIGTHHFHFTWAASKDKAPAKPPDSEENPGTDASLAGKSGTYSTLPMKCYNYLEKFTGVPWPVWSWKSLRHLRAAIRKADLVWLHDAPYMGNIAAFRMAKAARKPVVITQHIGLVAYKNPLLRGLMRLADRVFTQRMLARASQSAFVSDRVAEAYHRQISFKAPVMIIPNGVDPEMFYSVEAEQRWQLRAQFALRDEQPVLLFVGRFTEKKGLPVIKRLSELLPDWRFWLVGRGPIDPQRWYRPNIHVFSDRNGAALADLYRAADLFILPSFGEGFPLVIQEAMACGLPVLCSPATAAGSLLAKPFLLTATVDPASPERTASIWARKLKSQREYLPLSQANNDLANAAHYFWPWPKIAECYTSLFEDLCEDRAA